jgi:hypothetical protein
MVERKGVSGAIAGLPGIEGYKAKEDRRAADKQLRDHIANRLAPEERRLLDVQGLLASQQRYVWVAGVDNARAKLQLFRDRIKTASYGYGGLFDQGQVKEAELDALIAFDQALNNQCGRVNEAVTALERAIAIKEKEEGEKAMQEALDALNALFNELNETFSRRAEVLGSAA